MVEKVEQEQDLDTLREEVVRLRREFENVRTEMQLCRASCPHPRRMFLDVVATQGGKATIGRWS